MLVDWLVAGRSKPCDRHVEVLPAQRTWNPRLPSRWPSGAAPRPMATVRRFIGRIAVEAERSGAG